MLLALGTFVPLTIGMVSLFCQMKVAQERANQMAITGRLDADVGKDDGKGLRTVLFMASMVCGIVCASSEYALAQARKEEKKTRRDQQTRTGRAIGNCVPLAAPAKAEMKQ
jgi:hypothetical protein